MYANQLCKRLGRSDRGNRYRARRRVKIGIRSRDRPRSRKSAVLPFLDCEIERCQQLGRKYGRVEPRIQMRPCLAQCFSLFAYVKSKQLEISIIGLGKYERLVESEYRSAVRLRVCKREYEQSCDEYAGHF